MSSRLPASQFSIKIFQKPKKDQLRECINYVNQLEISSENFVEFYRQCVKSFTPKIEFDTLYMGRFFEYKTFLPLKPSFEQKECKWLTIGIGGTSFAEKNFKEKYPGCLVYGIEPSPDQYENFTDYGTVIPYGVGKIITSLKYQE
uniref:Uncharacterized protein n=1 Tax=Panagrolaimus davidi TaxID=227884 RepID=A0A914QJN8_9BILA